MPGFACGVGYGWICSSGIIVALTVWRGLSITTILLSRMLKQ
jgi:hypothetical protein